MSDLSAEIKEIEKALERASGAWMNLGIRFNKVYQTALRMKQLESIGVPPEHKRGHWIVHNDYSKETVECSECGWYSLARTNFCPDCGADMRGEEDDAGRS